MYDKINSAVRAVDPEALIFFAGVTWDDLGAGFTAAPGGAAFANRSVLAYHYYPPPQLSVPLQYESYTQAAKRLGTAAFLTETSAPGSPWPQRLAPSQRFETPGGVGDGADAALQSWAGFEWKSFCREAPGTASGATNVSQLGSWGACKTGYSSDWPGNEPSAASKAAYGRTYATAVAGDIVAVYFNVTSGAFTLQYDAAGAVGIAQPLPTEIFLWPERYPGGANVTAAASEGAVRVEYGGPGSSLVKVYADQVKAGVRVVVTVAAR